MKEGERGGFGDKLIISFENLLDLREGGRRRKRESI
jgi:hypothetical protein